jgi:eukaryotic-like serine/threonine-protein kinase
VLEELGRGAMGKVSRADDRVVQRELALEEIRSVEFVHQAAAQMIAEARAMATLSHPNVVAVHDVEDCSSHHGGPSNREAQRVVQRWLRSHPRGH